MSQPAKKRCSRCGETKPAGEFPQDRSVKSNLYSQCKQCVAARKACWYQANKGKVREQQRSYRKARPAEARHQARCRYRKANKDWLNELSRQYYWQHREEARERHRSRTKRLRALRDWIRALRLNLALMEELADAELGAEDDHP